VADHQEMGAPELVQVARDALAEPGCITASKNHPQRECYYVDAPPSHGGPRLKVKVVVEFHRFSKRGMVVTAHRVPAITYGEWEVWRRS